MTGTTTGRWRVEGKLLNIDWGDKQSSRPFFFHNGQLVLPNIPNARRFWDRVRSSESATNQLERVLVRFYHTAGFIENANHDARHDRLRCFAYSIALLTAFS